MEQNENSSSLAVTGAIFMAYAVVTLVALLHHEVWRDETDVWMFVRELSLSDIVSFHSANSGHPVAYPMFIMPFSRLGLSVVQLQLVHWFVSLGFAGVLLFRSPFPTHLKTLLLFSIHLVHEYAVIGRGYGLGLLLLFLLLSMGRTGRVQTVSFAVLAALAINVEVHFLASVAFLVAWQLYENRNEDARSTTLLAAGVFGLSLLFLTYHMYPAEPTPLSGFSTLVSSYAEVVRALANGLLPLGKSRLPSISPLASGALVLLILGAALWVLRGSRKALLFFAVSMAWILYIMLFKRHAAFRLQGFAFIYLLSALWLLYAERKPRPRSVSLTVLYAVFVLNVTLGARAIYLEVRYEFSASKDMAGFILENSYADRVIFSHRPHSPMASLIYLNEAKPGVRYYVGCMGEFLSYGRFDGKHYECNDTEIATVIEKQARFILENDVLFLFSHLSDAQATQYGRVLHRTAGEGGAHLIEPDRTRIHRMLEEAELP